MSRLCLSLLFFFFCLTTLKSQVETVELPVLVAHTVEENGVKNGRWAEMYGQLRGTGSRGGGSFVILELDAGEEKNEFRRSLIVSLTLQIRETKTAGSRDGRFSVYLVQEGYPEDLGELRFEARDRPRGVGSQVGSLLLLGSSFEFESGSGEDNLHVWTLALSDLSRETLSEQLSTGQKARFVLVPEIHTLFAAFAGPSNKTENGRSNAPLFVFEVQ